MDLGKGTALAVDSPGMTAMHAELAERFHGIIQQRDNRRLRLHITIQNKVSSQEARALQMELTSSALQRNFRFSGLGLYLWHDGLWHLERVYPFRG